MIVLNEKKKYAIINLLLNLKIQNNIYVLFAMCCANENIL